MTTFLSINGILYYEGTIIQSLPSAWNDHEICKSGVLLRIALLLWQKSGSCQVGVYSPEVIDHWNSIDDHVENRHGYWIDESRLSGAFVQERLRVEVIEKAAHRGKDLLGRKGTYLCPLDDTADRAMSSKIFRPEFLFIEMDEHVGGSGCDGLGKKGHCVLVPSRAVKFEKQKEAVGLCLTK